MKSKITRWAIKHSSKNRIDGLRQWYDFNSQANSYRLFNTRKEARNYIEKLFSYIRNRPDLKAEPHGWRMPVAVKVKLTINQISK